MSLLSSLFPVLTFSLHVIPSFASVTDFRLCVQLLSGDTNKMLSSANLKAVICFSLR